MPSTSRVKPKRPTEFAVVGSAILLFHFWETFLKNMAAPLKFSFTSKTILEFLIQRKSCEWQNIFYYYVTISHLSDLGIVTQRDCATTTLHFLLLVVHMEWKILIEHIPNPASDKFKAYFFPNFGHICTKI